MWFTNDSFHFVWTRMSGDMQLAADVHWPGTNGDPHRKACVMIRQSLDADSPYADAVVHGNGLTSLQARTEPGATTVEVQSAIASPGRVAIEKRGAYYYMLVADHPGGMLRPAGGSFRLALRDRFYIGLGVCAHNDTKLETATFSNVVIQSFTTNEPAPTGINSTLETISVASGDRRVLYQSPERFESPNWSHDGTFLVFNRKGLLYRLPVVGGGRPEPINTGLARKCNNDHGFSPDGVNLAISDSSENRKIIDLHFTGKGRSASKSNQPTAHPTGMAGRRTARCWRFAASAMGSSMFIPFLRMDRAQSDD